MSKAFWNEDHSQETGNKSSIQEKRVEQLKE
jgi:hypothetical protein